MARLSQQVYNRRVAAAAAAAAAADAMVSTAKSHPL
jgi:hypothetical protein